MQNSNNPSHQSRNNSDENKNNLNNSDNKNNTENINNKVNIGLSKQKKEPSSDNSKEKLNQLKNLKYIFPFLSESQSEIKEEENKMKNYSVSEYKNIVSSINNNKSPINKNKTEEKQTQILAEINDIQPKIKQLYKYDKYCKEITKRAGGIQNNLNNFDKDIQKEQDNSRSI